MLGWINKYYMYGDEESFGKGRTRQGSYKFQVFFSVQEEREQLICLFLSLAKCLFCGLVLSCSSSLVVPIVSEAIPSYHMSSHSSLHSLGRGWESTIHHFSCLFFQVCFCV